jgi:hypothetical protein
MSVSLGRSILREKKQKFCFGVGLDDVIHSFHQKKKHSVQTSTDIATLKTYLPNFGRKRKEKKRRENLN